MIIILISDKMTKRAKSYWDKGSIYTSSPN